MSAVNRVPATQPSSVRKVIVASLIGTSLEWYDFFIYGTAAALVFNEIFFPSFEPLVGTLLAFTTYAVGFIARPLGGLIFGHYGDRVGRKNVLVVTLMLMGIAIFSFKLLFAYHDMPKPDLTVKAVGYQWYWGYEYQPAVTITAPTSEPIRPDGRSSRPSPAIRLISRPPTNDPAMPDAKAVGQSMWPRLPRIS